MSASQLPLETLLAILILLFYTISAPLFEKFHFHYMHESGLCMLIGIGITMIAMIISPEHNFAQHLKFDNEIFFTFILPPIIFAAGYNLRRRSFFKYFLYIFLYGVVGTIVTFSIVCPLTYLANRYKMFSLTFGKEIEHMSNNLNLIDTNKTVENYTNLSKNITGRNSLLNDSDILDKINQTLRNLNIDIVNSNNETENDLNNTTNNSSDSTLPVKEEIMKPQIEVVEDEFILNFSFREILLFSAVIAATDTVAALTFVKEENEPKLFAILFGEGVINDAVCIVLYGIIKDFSSSNQEFTSKTPFKMFGSFMTMFFFSFLIGAKVGILSSLFLKKLKFIHLNRVQECSIIVFFAFISYTLTEELGLSPIIALLFTGIFMSHYTFYNLSFQAREESSVVSRIMSNVAEAFVFTYLGLTVIYNTQMAFSLSFFFWELIFVVSGRFAAIYGISYFMSLFKIRSFNIKSSQKGIMSCAGSIRGAIAFGLAISIDTKNRINKEVLISSTLMLVLFTTIVFGALMPVFIKFFSKLDDLSNDDYAEMQHLQSVDFGYLHPNFSNDKSEGSKEKDKNKLKERLSYWLGTYWIDFDNVYMKPKLIHNWPAVKQEHDDVSKIIKNTMREYKNNSKSNNNLMKSISQDELDRDRHSKERHMSRDEISHGEIDGEDNNFNRLKTEEKYYKKK